jgi:hypothetical protein
MVWDDIFRRQKNPIPIYYQNAPTLLLSNDFGEGQEGENLEV